MFILRLLVTEDNDNMVMKFFESLPTCTTSSAEVNMTSSKLVVDVVADAVRSDVSMEDKDCSTK